MALTLYVVSIIVVRETPEEMEILHEPLAFLAGSEEAAQSAGMQRALELYPLSDGFHYHNAVLTEVDPNLYRVIEVEPPAVA